MKRLTSQYLTVWVLLIGVLCHIFFFVSAGIYADHMEQDRATIQKRLSELQISSDFLFLSEFSAKAYERNTESFLFSIYLNLWSLITLMGIVLATHAGPPEKKPQKERPHHPS